MTFDSANDVREYYSKYVNEKGFGVTKRSSNIGDNGELKLKIDNIYVLLSFLQLLLLGVEYCNGCFLQCYSVAKSLIFTLFMSHCSTNQCCPSKLFV